jgi:hypothetical protein
MCTQLILKSAEWTSSVRHHESIESENAQTVGKLVFQYGNEYFLSEAWTPGSKIWRQLRTTSDERELAARRGIETGTTVAATAK